MSEGTIEKLHARVVSDALTYWRVPTLFPGSTIVCIGGGPSLTVPDLAQVVLAEVPRIAINDAYRIDPNAEVVYAHDHSWWSEHPNARQCPGLLVTATPAAAREFPELKLLRNAGPTGLELDPTGVRTGSCGGYQAINLAVHLGAKRILLLGYDCMPGPDGRHHWFGNHQDRLPPPYADFLSDFPTLVDPLKAIGVQVINCSRVTALTCFSKARLEDVLP